MTSEPVDASRNEAGAAQTIHRALHRRGVTHDIFSRRAFRYSSHGAFVASPSAREFDWPDWLVQFGSWLGVLAEYRTAVLACRSQD